ncbi:MAG: protoporphyrinogen/coproporphyrinogen oxidase [Thermoplasmataceae archaeon]
MKKTDLTILGGGWAGLLCALLSRNKNPDITINVFEKDRYEERGGLLRSEVESGFTFDIGGPHILFSRNRIILEKIVSILGENVRQHERKAIVRYKGQNVPYPFENGLYTLKPEERVILGSDLIKAMIKSAGNPEWTPKTFEDWIFGYFGGSIARDYLMPYNRKIWKEEPSNMDADWVYSPGRLPFPEVDEIVRSIAGLPSIGYKEQATFYYPVKGGIQALYDSLLEKVTKNDIDVIFGTEIRSCKKEQNSWLINGNFRSSSVISTLPLRTINRVFDLSDEAAASVSKLTYNKDIVVGVALKVPTPDYSIMYVPQSDVPFHRLTWMSSLIPVDSRGQSNLIAETTVSQNDSLDNRNIVNETISGLIKLGIIKSESDVIFSKQWVNELAYPIYNNGHENFRYNALSYLKNMGIKSVGRWGSWHYWNTDKVYEAVENLVNMQ